MTFKIKMLTAAAVLCAPALAGAQVVGGAAGAVQGQVSAPVQSTVNDATETTRELTPPVQDTVRDTTETVQDTTDAATGTAQDTVGTATDANAGVSAGAQAGAQAGPVTQATAADIQAGASVRDQSGGMVGTIESVSAEGAVVSTGTVRAQLPIASFGKDSRGLVIAMTKTQLEAAAGARSPS